MEDQLHIIVQIVVLACYIVPTVAGKGHDMSCNVAPLMDRKSFAALLGNDKAFVNGISVEEVNNIYSTQMCFPHSEDHSGSRKAGNLMRPQGKSSITKRDNKSKVMPHSKMETKKVSNNKKLKGSKRQRKKEKKKKVLKKKKKS